MFLSEVDLKFCFALQMFLFVLNHCLSNMNVNRVFISRYLRNWINFTACFVLFTEERSWRASFSISYIGLCFVPPWNILLVVRARQLNNIPSLGHSALYSLRQTPLDASAWPQGRPYHGLPVDTSKVTQLRSVIVWGKEVWKESSAWPSALYTWDTCGHTCMIWEGATLCWGGGWPDDSSTRWVHVGGESALSMLGVMGLRGGAALGYEDPAWRVSFLSLTDMAVVVETKHGGSNVRTFLVQDKKP